MPILAVVSLIAVLLMPQSSSTAAPPLEKSEVAVVAAVAPVYPHVAATSRVSGETVVEVSIERSGRVIGARVLEGHKLLSPISELTARRWRFAASEVEAIRTARVQFSFVLLSADAVEDDAGITFLPPSRVELRYKPDTVVLR